MTVAKKTKPDDDEDVNPYGVAQETEEEIREFEKNRPKFGEVKDKFRRSMRGPASAALVMPSKLLIAVAFILAIVSIVWFIMSMWPITFNEAGSSDEEIVEALVNMLLATLGFATACVIGYGSYKMITLESYTWAMVGAAIAIPLLVGILAMVTLRDPKVVAGFQEVEGAADDGEIDDEDDEDDDDEDDDEEDEDEDEDDDD